MKRQLPTILPAAVAALLFVSACGGDSASSEATVPAVSETDQGSSGEPGRLAPRPIELTGGSAGGNAVATAESAAGDRMASDMAMPYRIVNFVAGGELPALPTNDIGYLYGVGAEVTEAQVAALAAALGVSGEPQRIDDGFSTYWRIGPDDGTAPSLWVYQDAQQGWSYSSAWATQTSPGAVGCAIAEPAVADVAVDPAAGTETTPPPGDVVEPVCEEPEPPVGVPTAAEAESRLRQLIEAIGLDPAAFSFDTYGDEWYASATATETIGGVGAGRVFSAGFGAEGVMQYAGGQLATPVEVGPYPLVDLETAIARLNDPSGFYGGFGGGIVLDAGVARGDVAVAAEVAVAEAPPATAVAVGAPETVPGEAPVIPEPEQVTVTLVDVQADVWWAWDVDGSVWLLPAYRFIGDDGGWYTVPAVTDEFLVRTDPVAVEPGVVEPGVVEPGVVDEVTGGATGGVDGVDATFDTSQLEPALGSSLEEFATLAESLGASVRTVIQDGEALAVTEDYSPTRVNVAVDGGIVTSIESVG